MKFSSIFRRLTYALALWGVLLASCTPEATLPEEGFTIYYPAITEIAPGTQFTIAASWRGGVPTDFAITSVKCDGVPVVVECFTIEPATGAFRINGSDNLQVGMYTVAISCNVGGSTHTFADVINIKMMKPVADGIVVEPSFISAAVLDIRETAAGVELPTARITTTGENFVKITGYSVANVYRDGVLLKEAKKWFEVSDDGVFSIVKNNESIEPGIYTFDFKLTTYKVDKNSEEGIFSGALTLKVTSAPYSLVYNPSSQRVEKGFSAKSVAPDFIGTTDGVKYEIKGVSPNNAPGITVDENTGVINIPASDNTQIGDIYTVSLTVTNDYGVKDFDDIYSIEIISFLNPITAFAYDDVEGNISGVALTIPVKTMDGDEVIYSLKNLPESLSAIEINTTTGEITTAKGVELPIGDHTVTVLAENSKGQMETTVKINVVQNPNYFTYVYWGNNLGEGGQPLEPIEKYGNQFRLFHTDVSTKFPILKSDIPDGRPVKFEVIKPVKPDGNPATGSNIDVNAKDGRIGVYAKTKGTTLTFTVVHVTVGEGESAITRKFPVFADLCGYENGYQILYTPFVFRVNPKTGGVSEAPVITKMTDEGKVIDVTAETTLDYRTNSYFFNLYGPESHTWNDKIQNDAKGEFSFLSHVWRRYFEATAAPTFNPYLAGPMSWWENYQKGYLDFTGAYVDHKNDKRITVNQDKFKDDEGNYADGVFWGYMNFKTCEQIQAYGENPLEGEKDKQYYQVSRAFIWLDPTYTENN